MQCKTGALADDHIAVYGSIGVTISFYSLVVQPHQFSCP